MWSYTLVIATPPFDTNGTYNPFLPHLVEHCIGGIATPQARDFFQYIVPFEYSFHGFYTQISWYGKEDARQQILNTLNTSLIPIKKNLLEEEEFIHELQ